MDYTSIRREKVNLLYFSAKNPYPRCEADDSGTTEASMPTNMDHYFILTGSKKLDPFRIADLLEPAYRALDLLGVCAQPCITNCIEGMLEETGYDFAFEDWITITPDTAPELLSTDTGSVSLAEAIAIWVLKQLGGEMDNVDEVIEEYALHCIGIEPILSAALKEVQVSKQVE